MCNIIIDYLPIFAYAAMISTPFVSIYILRKTLKQEREHQEEFKRNTQNQHSETLRAGKEQHKETLTEQEGIGRVSLMPYLVIQKERIKQRVGDGEVWLTIPFVNKGNGTAVQMQGKYINVPEMIGPMCESHIGRYGCVQPFDMEDNIVMQEKECAITIYGKHMRRELVWMDDIKFSIVFKDMRLNQYEQCFLIQMHLDENKKEINIPRVASYIPTFHGCSLL